MCVINLTLAEAVSVCAVTDSRVFLPERLDIGDAECYHASRGHPSRREANWERRESSVSDSVALETVTAPQPAWMSDSRRRAMLSRQDAMSSGSSNTDSTPRLQSPPDGSGSLPWLLSPGVASSPPVSPLWTGSGLPPPPSWTLRSPGLRPVSTVQRSVSSASSRTKPEYAGWSYDRSPAATRHTANSQPSVSTQRQAFRPRAQRPGDWIMHNARVKPKTRPHHLPGLSGHEVDRVVRRATTNSDNSLSSSDSDGRRLAKSRDKQVPVTIATADNNKQQSQFLSVDSTDETRTSASRPRLRLPLTPHVGHEPAADLTADAGSTGNVTAHALNVPPTSGARRRSISLVRTSSAFSRSFDDDDDAQ